MRRQLGRLAAVVAGAAVFLLLVQLGGGKGIVSAVFGWGVLGYLLWRAFPAVKDDWRVVFGHLPQRGGRSRRGDHL